MTHQTRIDMRDRPIAFGSVPIPGWWIEYGYYVTILYSMLAPGAGLEIPLLASAANLFLAATCVWQARSRIKRLYAPLKFLLLAAASFVLIQIIIHKESLVDEKVRGFLLGFAQLIIVYSLCRKPGFVFRFPLVLFIIGVMALPFLTFDPGLDRARVDASVIQGSLSHPNGLAGWFGFCSIYFAVVGIQNNRLLYRLGAWGLSATSLFVVGLAVSRGPLIGIALAFVVAFRGVLKRGFVPMLLITILIGLVSMSGVFDDAISRYEERGTEDTGRQGLWGEAMERILMSPMFGVGVSEVGTPHNTFLYFGSASGLVPLVFFLLFWLQAMRSSVTAPPRPMNAIDKQYELYRLPYLLFTLVATSVGDLAFLLTWALLAVSIAAGPLHIPLKRRFLVVGARRGITRAKTSQTKRSIGLAETIAARSRDF